MSLPTLETPTFELTLPSTDMKVKYRPFLVKEEKILLQALESAENKQIIQALQDICHACTFGVLDVNKLPTFDLEYVFLQIRAKSVGEIAKVRLLCPDDKETYASLEIDLTKVEVHVEDEHDNNIVIDEKRNLGIIMKYPTISTVDPSEDVKGMGTKRIFEMMAKTIYQVYEGEKTFAASDYKTEELHEFIEGLDSKTFENIQKFYQTMPQLRHEVELENPKTKVKSKIMLRGIQDFFLLPSHTKA